MVIHTRPARHVRFRTTCDGGVLLDAKNGHMYGLNPVAATAWTAIVAGGGVDNAVRSIVAVFDVDEETVRTDVTVLIEGLVQHGFLEEAL